MSGFQREHTAWHLTGDRCCIVSEILTVEPYDVQARILAAVEAEADTASGKGLLKPEMYVATNRFNTKPNKVGPMP